MAAAEQKATLYGVMASPDAYGRMRVSIVDTKPDGSFNESWGKLKRIAPRLLHNPDYSVPYEEITPVRDGLRAIATITLPRSMKDTMKGFWLGKAEELRASWVKVEVTARRFKFAAREGVALDFVHVERLL